MGVWDNVKVWAKRSAIERAMRRPAPGSYPLTGPEVARRNFLDITMWSETGDALFSASKREGEILVGKWFEPDASGGHTSTDKSLAISDAQQLELRIRYLFGGADHTFRNAWTYLIGGESRVKLSWWLTMAFRGISHLQDLARQDRMRVLSIVVDRKIEDDHATSSIDVLLSLHDKRWLYHPQKDSQMRHIKMILESLEETGDVVRDETRYRPARKALATLHQFETDQKRFRTQNFHSWMIAFLTFALVVLTAIQVWGIIFPKPPA
jgi:hypothetical protein